MKIRRKTQKYRDQNLKSVKQENKFTFYVTSKSRHMLSTRKFQ